MARDFASYLPPGVYVEEIPAPVIVAGITPTVLALVGDTPKARAFADAWTVVGTTPQNLSQPSVNRDTIVLRDRWTGVTYVGPATPMTGGGPWTGRDYTVTSIGVPAGGYSITRVVGGGSILSDGADVQASYEALPTDYFDVFRFTEYEDVREAYGEPFNPDGTIKSPLTFGALLAFRNGANEIVAVAVNRAGVSPTLAEWQAAIDKLIGEESVNVVTALSGDVGVHTYLRDHMVQMEALGQLRRGIAGMDGTAATVGPTELKSRAALLDSTRMVLVGPGTFEYDVGTAGIAALREVGGQFAAAAVAGLHSALPPQEPLTNKNVVAFAGIPGQPSARDQSDLQRLGTAVLHMDRFGAITVGHSVTTKQNPDVYKRELSVQAARDRLRTLLEEALRASDLIGSAMTSESGDLVLSVVTGSLEAASTAGLIQDYSDAKWRQLVTNPTVIEVRFLYLPTLPINYVSVVYSIDTTTGEQQISSEELVPVP